MEKKALEIKNLSYSYPDGTAALSGINLNVFEGEAIGIIGPNGAGKSTLLLHLNGILKANSSIKVFNLDVNEKNLSQIRSNVGLVFQDPENQLFMPTVFDDVSFGPVNMSLSKDEVVMSVNSALKEVDMLKAIDRSSHHLSFGEKKRISIATVLSMKPRILALDEPSSNLDPKHRRDLINFLKQKKLTMVIATHDLDLVVETCSRVILLYKGKIAADGNCVDVLSNKSLLEAHSLEIPCSLLNNYSSPEIIA